MMHSLRVLDILELKCTAFKFVNCPSKLVSEGCVYFKNFALCISLKKWERFPLV